MLIDYDPITLALIIDLPNPLVKRLIPTFAEAIRQLESTDRGYVYPGAVVGSKSTATSQLAALKHSDDFRLDIALKHTVNLLQAENTNNHIFVILQQYNPAKDEYHAQKGLDADLRCGGNTHFVFCDIGYSPGFKQLCGYHPRCDYLLVEDIADVGKQFIKMYYPENERHAIDEEFKLKYGLTPQEARLKLKEQYEKNIPNPTDTKN